MGDDCGATSPVIPHPPFPHHQPPPQNYSSSWESLPCCGNGCQQPWKKNWKIQKKLYTVFVYIKMYKSLLFLFPKNIVSDYLAFNLIKVTALSIYNFFIWINFFINAGIEPAFSVKFGNRTRIYCVFRESNPDFKTLYVGDGWRYERKKILYRDLVPWAWKVCFYLGNRTLGTYVVMVKSFWVRHWCRFIVLLLLKLYI